MVECNHHQQAPESVIDDLHPSQGGSGRHKCIICAYAAGFLDASHGKVYNADELELCQVGNQAPIAVLVELPEYQAGAGRHLCSVCAYQAGYTVKERLAAVRAALETESVTHGGNIDQYVSDPEGRRVLEEHYRYERSPENRAEAIRFHGTICMGCGFDFNQFYGEQWADDYIEIHHLRPVSALHGDNVDPHTDLIPLCSNCHSMVHRRTTKMLSLEELRAKISSAKRGDN